MTGNGLAIQSIATVTDGSFSDTLLMIPGADNTAYRQGPTERAGVYDLQVSAPGYSVWALDNITVIGGHCGVTSARVLAQLQPE